jgi:hypothetical protein
MRVLILGTTGGTGREIVREACRLAATGATKDDPTGR